jgi:hypothetical protein
LHHPSSFHGSYWNDPWSCRVVAAWNTLQGAMFLRRE